MQPTTRSVTGWLLVALQFILLAGIVVSPRRDAAGAWIAAGAVVAAAGVCVMGWTFASLGNALTATPVPREGAYLRTTGPFARVRHPIYLGLLLAAWGWVLAWGGWLTLACAIALAALLAVKARWEDSMLHAAHGDAWESWAKRTPMIVPRLARQSGSRP